MTNTPARILVVDDCAEVADVMREAFVMLGHEARAASDGAEALELIGTWDPDVAIIDMSMPLDGCKLAGLIRARGTGRPYLVAITGFAGATMRERAMAAGFHDFIEKPAGVDDLAAVVERACAVLRGEEGKL